VFLQGSVSCGHGGQDASTNPFAQGFFGPVLIHPDLFLPLKDTDGHRLQRQPLWCQDVCEVLSQPRRSCPVVAVGQASPSFETSTTVCRHQDVQRLSFQQRRQGAVDFLVQVRGAGHCTVQFLVPLGLTDRQVFCSDDQVNASRAPAVKDSR
jgi:hypothetical protein